MPRQH